MGRYIIKLKDHYLEWSTIVDAPVTFGMTLDEFRAHYQAEYGAQGMRDFEERLKRVEAKGTSAIDRALDEVIVRNRAGPDEHSLRKHEIYKAYCLREPIRNGWRVPSADDD